MTGSHPIHAAERSLRGAKELRLRRALLRWYRAHARILPWRGSRDPYPIWVSEIMLQQTQVASVAPYYVRFVRAFPSLERLAQARLERVLELWSGLGYYRRARLLHRAAQRVRADYGGRFPSTAAEARSLPGVGEYTAAAVLSMAYGVPLAALDGNVARVLARLDALRGSLAESTFRRRTQTRLSALLSHRHPGDFNQALMELGQTVCLPRAPRCGVCPWRRDCRARRMGKPEAFPSPRSRRATEEHHLAAGLIIRPRATARRASAASFPGCGEGGLDTRPVQGLLRRGSQSRVFLVRGLDDGLMGDLWNFPSAFGVSPAQARSRLLEKLASMGGGGAGARLGKEVARLNHGVTYRRISVRVYPVEPAAPDGPDIRWLPFSRFERAAVSQLARKIARALISSDGIR